MVFPLYCIWCSEKKSKQLTLCIQAWILISLPLPFFWFLFWRSINRFKFCHGSPNFLNQGFSRIHHFLLDKQFSLPYSNNVCLILTIFQYWHLLEQCVASSHSSMLVWMCLCFKAMYLCVWVWNTRREKSNYCTWLHFLRQHFQTI